MAMDPSNPHILILDNNSPFVLPLLRSFCRDGKAKVDVLVFTRHKIRPFRHSRHINRLFVRKELCAENLVPVIEEVVAESGANFLLPTREWISALLWDQRKQVEEIIRLHPLPSSGTLDITGDKWNLNQWLMKCGYPAALCSLPGAEWQGEYPFLLKPRIGIAGDGIRKINGHSELEAELKAIDPEEYFLMELIPGHDIDISFFAMEGEILIHTIQKGIVNGNFTYSRGITFLDNKDLLHLVKDMVRQLNYTGIAHLDFRYSIPRNEFILVDFNARYWSSVMGSVAMGVNFPTWIEAFSAGKNPKIPTYRKDNYYFASTALLTLWSNLFSRNKNKVRIRDTQMWTFLKDPVPELCFIVRRLNFFRKKP